MVAPRSRVALGGIALGAMLCCRAPVSAGAAPTPTPTSTEPAPSPSGSDSDRTRFVVAAIADSLTDFAAHGGLYLRYLKERCPESRFDSYGKGGDMVNQMRRRFVRDVFGPESKSPPYTHVIVFGGVNDLYSDLTANRTLAKIEADLSALYAAAHEHGATVVAITVAPWAGFTRYYTEARGRNTEALNRWILAEAGHGAVDVALDSGPLLSCGDPARLCDRYRPPFKDGLHFGPEGHKRLADALERAVFRRCR